MATHPECQKQGLASAILKSACERADRQGVEFYLDASAKGRPLYEKFGFVAEMDKMDPEASSDPMRRPSKVD
jgi:GNAT superfamily N-acetyltransferase